MSNPMLYTALDVETPLCVPYDIALEVLEKGEIHAEHGLMRWGSNYTFLVNVEYDDHEFMAIYKPRMGERPLWDFPDGTLCQRETASYVLSQMLGWHIVPPTVLREGPRGIGSLQAFINHDPNQHYFNLREHSTSFDSLETQIKRMVVFDTIANNADRKGGHCLVDEAAHLWGIDHGLTFHPAHKLRTVIWEYAGETIDEDTLAAIAKLCKQLDDHDDPQRQRLADLISNQEMLALQSRVNKLLKTATYPLPGPGPNRPWPAV